MDGDSNTGTKAELVQFLSFNPEYNAVRITEQSEELEALNCSYEAAVKSKIFNDAVAKLYEQVSNDLLIPYVVHFLLILFYWWWL